MGGDCAETFNEFSVNHIRDTFRVLLQMSLVLTFGGSMPVIKMGRMAGQFAKPRSEDSEVRDGVTLPSYRGDIINSDEFSEAARMHNPSRMLDAYHQSAQTLNILRAFSSGGYADISRLHAWNLDFVENLPVSNRYREMCGKVDESLRFLKAIGVDTTTANFRQTDFYTSHECLLLPYEEALTRQDSITGRYYDCSAHMLWLGERTRQLDHAHVEFVKGELFLFGVWCVVLCCCLPGTSCDTLLHILTLQLFTQASTTRWASSCRRRRRPRSSSACWTQSTQTTFQVCGTCRLVVDLFVHVVLL